MKFIFKNKRNRRTVHVKNVMMEMLDDCNIQKPIFVEVVKQNWDTIVNPLIAAHSRPERIYKNILYIAVDHTTYANEIIIMKDIIMKNISKVIIHLEIQDIRVEIKRMR